MSLSQSTDPFGALPENPAPAPGAGADRPSPLAELEASGKVARAQLEAWLDRARSRARRLLALQLALALFAALLFGLLASAALAARVGPQAGRILFLAWLAALPVALFLQFRASRRGSLAKAALGRDPLALGALLVAKSKSATSAGSELLSSIQFREPTDRSQPFSPPAPGTSGALLALLHQRAAKWSQSIDLREAISAKALRWPGVALAIAILAALVADARAPQFFRLGVLRLWLGEGAMPIPENEPIAGDLSITYLYPAYTNLPARVEEGTPGDLKAPRGTEVRLTARADRDLVQAFAVLDDRAIPLDVSGPGNRLLAGSFKLEKRGRWRFRFADKKGRPVAEGPDRAIEILADQPPSAMISDPVKSEVEVDPLGKLPVIWSASDDYGLGKVALIWQRPGDPEERIELSSPAPGAVARRLSGTYGWEMAPLQLREGDKISFRVEALDEDAIDGPQRGTSATHTLTVFSAAQHRKEGLSRAQALWERLVVLLADRLDEKPPPGIGPANANVRQSSPSDTTAWYSELQSRDARALQLISEMRKAGTELSKDKLAPRALGRALKYIASGMSPFVQRTVIARAPLSKPATSQPDAVRLLASALAKEIHEEEKDVLYLDDLLDQARIDDMQDLQRELKRSREELKRLAEKLRTAPDEATKKQVLAEVQRLRDRVQELMERMQAMAKGINDEHLNQEATQSAEKEQDLMSQLSEVQRKMQSGDVDAALSELDKLSKNLEQLEDGLQKSAQQRGSEKYAEEAKELRQAADKMAQLKSREEELEKRTGRLRKELRTQAQKRFEERGGNKLQEKLQAKVNEAKKQIARVDPHVADDLGLEDTLDAAQERVADLDRALKAGDYQEALEQASKAERAAAMLQTRLNLEDQLRQLNQPVEVRKSLEAAAEADQPLREITDQLQQAMPDEESQMSAEQQKEMQSQSSEQQEIQQGMKGVREQMAQVGKKVPIFGPQHEQLLQEAEGAMEQAGERLQERQPRGAEGSEGEALDKLGKFEQAMKDLAKQGGQGQGGMPMPWGEPAGSQEGDSGQGGSGDDEGDGDDQSKEHVDIPDAESSRGPQEFRKKLLDAMKQPAPEKFKDKVRGYYEELVK